MKRLTVPALARWALGLAVCLFAGGLRAEQSDTTPSDPKLGPAITLAAFGGAATIAGISVLAAYGDCSSTTFACTETQGPRSAGVGLLTSGVTSGLMSVAVWASLDSRAYPHRSTGMMGTGIVLTGLSTAVLVGGSVMLIRAGYEDRDRVWDSLGMITVSGIGMAIGLPLWLVGSAPPSFDAAQQRQSDHQVRRSPVMLTTGIGMSVVGAAGIATGIAQMVEYGEARSRDQAGALFVGFPVALAGATLAAIGAPLAAKGASRVHEHEAHGSAWPELSVGPGAASLKWTW